MRAESRFPERLRQDNHLAVLRSVADAGKRLRAWGDSPLSVPTLRASKLNAYTLVNGKQREETGKQREETGKQREETALLSAMNVVRELDPQAPNLLALDGQCSQQVVNSPA